MKRKEKEKRVGELRVDTYHLGEKLKELKNEGEINIGPEILHYLKELVYDGLDEKKIREIEEMEKQVMIEITEPERE